MILTYHKITVDVLENTAADIGEYLLATYAVDYMLCPVVDIL